MSKFTLPFYLIAGIAAIAALYAGLTGRNVPFITNERTAVIVLFASGFLMCSLGMISTFIAKAPAHPLTIMGYALGAIAMLAGVVQIFKLNVPFLNQPRNAMLVIAIVILLKVIIGRLSFLLPGKI